MEVSKRKNFGTVLVDLILAVPPAWEPSFQSLGVPALAAFARTLGYPVERFDLNIAFARHVLGGPEIDIRALWAACNDWTERTGYRALYELRRDDEKIRIDLPFGFAHLVCNNYSRIWEFLSDRAANPYLSYFESCGIADRFADIRAGSRRLVGLSMDSENQVVAALTLCRMLRARSADVFTVLGGPWITSMRTILAGETRLLADVDFLVSGKGEMPLSEILGALEAPAFSRGTAIPGVMSKTGDRFTAGPSLPTRVRGADLPMPEVFDPADYTRPNVVPYESERGCYWGKCRFCHHVGSYAHGRDSKPIDKVIAEIRHYRDSFGVEVIAFSDAAMPPKRVSQISDAFIARQMNLRWAAFARPERSFTAEMFQRAKRSGLDVLSFGVETASARLLDHIGKPQKVDDMVRVLRDCADAGIYTTAGIINGLPSETMDDLDELWRFLDRISDFVYLHPHLFKFERGTEFFENAGRYGLSVVLNHPESRLSVYFDFVDRSGGDTRSHLAAGDVNRDWWRAKMGRTLDWKSPGSGFCSAVNYIVDQ